MEKDWKVFTMGPKERKRLKVISNAIEKTISQKQAAEALEISDRQIRRIIYKVKTEGDIGITHGLKDKPSKRKISNKIKKKILKLYKEKYKGFGPTLMGEKLLELDRIKVSKETVRKILIENNDWTVHKNHPYHRKWRERKECHGMMLLMDGSHHDWLEGRGPTSVLMGYIDDATNEVFAEFYDYEGTIPAMGSLKKYIKKYGIPLCIYFDRHQTYKSNRKITIEEELEGKTIAKTQYERALEELGIKYIHAMSPQAKGRIERLFKTFQDRLVKEMRLKNIKTKEESNNFLEEYLPKFNKQFMVKPAKEADMHIPLPSNITLDRILSKQTKRTLRNDNSVTFNGRYYQILENPLKTRMKQITVEERTDGMICFSYSGINLKYTNIEKPIKQNETTMSQIKPNISITPHIPPSNHPWRILNTKLFKQIEKNRYQDNNYVG